VAAEGGLEDLLVIIFLDVLRIFVGETFLDVTMAMTALKTCVIQVQARVTIDHG
jgi:hypothetical protein